MTLSEHSDIDVMICKTYKLMEWIFHRFQTLLIFLPKAYLFS